MKKILLLILLKIRIMLFIICSLQSAQKENKLIINYKRMIKIVLMIKNKDFESICRDYNKNNKREKENLMERINVFL